MMLILSIIGFFAFVAISGAILTIVVMIPFKTASSVKKRKAKRRGRS